jgi:hypothetical protein
MLQSLRTIANRAGFDIVSSNRSAFAFSIHTRVLGINNVLDVGANIGQYALQLRASGYQSKIISFEPVKTAFDRLMKAKGNDTNWTAVNLALGNELARRKINVSACTEMSSFRVIDKPFEERLPGFH